jgi:hypothetical protein
MSVKLIPSDLSRFPVNSCKGVEMKTRNGQSNVILIIGLVLLGMALICAVIAILGQRKFVAGQVALKNTATQKDRPTVHEQLTVPGATTVKLEPGSYVIGLSGSDIGGEGFDTDTLEYPPVTWEISGPAEVAMDAEFDPLTVGNSTRAGTFTVTESGDYEIIATLPEGESTSYRYNVESNGFVVAQDVTNELAGGFAKAGVGFIQTLLGGLCGGLLGLIGLIMVVLHLVNSKKTVHQ